MIIEKPDVSHYRMYYRSSSSSRSVILAKLPDIEASVNFQLEKAGSDFFVLATVGADRIFLNLRHFSGRERLLAKSFSLGRVYLTAINNKCHVVFKNGSARKRITTKNVKITSEALATIIVNTLLAINPTTHSSQ